MAKPKRSKPSIRLFVTTDRANGERLGRIAVKATKEAGAIVSANTMHDRGMPAMLAALESCKECRAGTCDGSVHVRREGGATERKTAPMVPLDQDKPVETPAKFADSPKVVATGAGPLFDGAPSLIVTDAPAVPKRGRRPGSKNKPKEAPPDPPEHQALIDHYHQRFKEARGEFPAYAGADFRAFKALREKHGFEKAKAMIDFALTDSFWKPKATIQDIVKNPSKFVGTSAGKADGRPSSTQNEPLPPGWL